MCAPASANYRVGLSEQNSRGLQPAAWQALKLKRIRYILPWDYDKDPGQIAEDRRTSSTPRMPRKQDVLLMFTARRGC